MWLYIVFYLVVSICHLIQAPNPVCGGQLLKSEYILTSPGYPTAANPQGRYTSNTHCVWHHIGNGENTVISFKFWDIVIQIGANGSNSSCEYDYVNVTISSIGPQRYCGYKSPPDPIYGVGSLYVTFHSDGMYSGRGFQATYSIVDDFDPCDPHPCNNGLCRRREDKMRIKCICFPGATGDKCDVDIKECESNPCQNGASCDDSGEINTYICSCLPKWKGENCELEKPPPCQSSPCVNGGTCEEILESFEYICSCPDGYSGQDCETKIGCGNPGIPSLPKGRRFSEYTSLLISCREGFVLEGDDYITCFDGLWNPSMPECKNELEESSNLSPWSLTMLVLGLAMTIQAIAFTVWMVYRGPCLKPGQKFTLSDCQTKKIFSKKSLTSMLDKFRFPVYTKGKALNSPECHNRNKMPSISGTLSMTIDEVFDDETLDCSSFETQSYASSYQL